MPTSLAQKLRILEGSRVALLNAPDGYARTLDPLPGGAEVTTIAADAGEQYDVTLLFARDHDELERLAPSRYRRDARWRRALDRLAEGWREDKGRDHTRHALASDGGARLGTSVERRAGRDVVGAAAAPGG